MSAELAADQTCLATVKIHQNSAQRKTQISGNDAAWPVIL